jgi:glycosyltransferase involved in cell wall biosynthesis
VILAAHRWWLQRAPLRYFHTLIRVVWNFPDWESFKIFIKAAECAREISESSTDLLYVHESDRSFVFAYTVSQLSQRRLVMILHTYYLFVQNHYLASKIRLSDGVIFQSEYSKDVASQHTQDLYAHKMHVVSSPGIDLTTFAPKSDRLGNEGDELVICSIGRLAEAKGFEYLLHAISELKSTYPQMRCKIIGEGELRGKLEALIERLGLTKHVKLLGALPQGQEMVRLLQESDLFVLPSVQDSEGVHDVHPNAVKEAMAVGLPVITTRLGGINEVIEQGVDGFLVAPGSVPELRREMEHVLTMTHSQRRAIGRKARAKIQQLYDSKKITQELIKVFAQYET